MPDGSAVDLRTASRIQLRSSLFPGDLILRSEDADLSTHSGIVSLLDMIVLLPRAYLRASTHGHASFGFVDLDSLLHMESQGRSLQVSATYTSDVIVGDKVQFFRSLLGFLDEHTGQLVDDYPELLDNPNFLEAMFGSPPWTGTKGRVDLDS
ncbi:hypothetical protein SMC26_26620 [Actinomadura fulvescens]